MEIMRKEITLVDEVYNVMDNSGLGPAMKIEQDDTDHIYFKCPIDGSDLVFTKIEVNAWGYHGKTWTVLRLHFLCPTCGRTYYRKCYQPEGLGNPNTIEEDLFKVGLENGWIGNSWMRIMDIVVSNKYSKGALEYVGLGRERFKKFKRLWKIHHLKTRLKNLDEWRKREGDQDWIRREEKRVKKELARLEAKK